MAQSAVSCLPQADGTLVEQLTGIVGRQLSLPSAAIQADTPLDSLGITSVDVVAIVWAIEERFQVEVDLARLGEGAIRAIRDVSALAAAVEMARHGQDVLPNGGAQPRDTRS